MALVWLVLPAQNAALALCSWLEGPHAHWVRPLWPPRGRKAPTVLCVLLHHFLHRFVDFLPAVSHVVWSENKGDQRLRDDRIPSSRQIFASQPSCRVFSNILPTSCSWSQAHPSETSLGLPVMAFSNVSCGEVTTRPVCWGWGSLGGKPGWLVALGGTTWWGMRSIGKHILILIPGLSWPSLTDTRTGSLAWGQGGCALRPFYSHSFLSAHKAETLWTWEAFSSSSARGITTVRASLCCSQRFWAAGNCRPLLPLPSGLHSDCSHFSH